MSWRSQTPGAPLVSVSLALNAIPASRPAALELLATAQNANPAIDEALSRVLLTEFADASPPGTALLIRPIFDEVNGLSTDVTSKGAESPRPAQPPAGGLHFLGDLRWSLLYRHPLVLGVIRWGAAKSRAQKDQLESSLSSQALADELEATFGRLLRHELNEFWEMAARVLDTGDVSLLHTMDTLALIVSLSLAVLATEMYQLGPFLARSFIKQLAAIWKFGRIPGEEKLPTDLTRLDDFLVAEVWCQCFWFVAAVEAKLAAGTGTPLILDPPNGFPTMRASAPLCTIPPPSRREINGPTPPDILRLMAPFRAQDLLGWLDPLRIVEPGWEEKRDFMLEKTMGSEAHMALGHMLVQAAYLAAKMSEFSLWLRDVAGLRILDVVIASELNSADGSEMTRDQLAAGAGVPITYLDRLEENEHVAEAIRRRSFLRDCALGLESSIAPEILAGARAADDSFLTSPNITLFVPISTVLRQLVMVMDTPEPFQDLSADSGSVADDKGRLSTDEDGEPEPLLRIWFHSAAFSETTKSASITATTLRAVLDRWPKEILRDDLVAGQFGIAAIFTIWFYLLVLQRFRWLVSKASSSLLEHAYELYTGIQSEVAMCLDLLEITGKPHLLSARTIFQSIMDGSRTTLSKAEVQILRLARGKKRCRHGADASTGGNCWRCMMEQRTRRTSIASIGGEDDPLAQIPVRTLTSLSGAGNMAGPSEVVSDDESGGDESSWVESLAGDESTIESLPQLYAITAVQLSDDLRPRRVTFRDTVDVFETYSIEEYPGRSNLYNDEPEDAGAKAEAKLAAEVTSRALGEMLRQRGHEANELPNLLPLWGKQDDDSDE